MPGSEPLGLEAIKRDRLDDESMRITGLLLLIVRKELAGCADPSGAEPDEHKAVRCIEEEARRARASEAALVAEVERLRGVLALAEQAMNHMGDALNEMDAVEAEDEKVVGPAFRAVRAALGKPMPGDEDL